jgi:hypothetical protein
MGNRFHGNGLHNSAEFMIIIIFLCRCVHLMFQLVVHSLAVFACAPSRIYKSVSNTKLMRSKNSVSVGRSHS